MDFEKLRNYGKKPDVKNTIINKFYTSDVMHYLGTIASSVMYDTGRTDREGLHGGEPESKLEYHVLLQIEKTLDKFEVAPLSEMSEIWDYHYNEADNFLNQLEFDTAQLNRFESRNITSINYLKILVRNFFDHIKEKEGF